MQRIPKEQKPPEAPRPKPQITESLVERGFPSEAEPQNMEWLANKGFKNPRLVKLWIKCAALAAFTWGSWEACMWWISRRDCTFKSRFVDKISFSIICLFVYLYSF